MDERYFLAEVKREIVAIIADRAGDDALKMTIMIIAQVFADMMLAAPQMAISFNAALAPVGWQLVPVR